MKRVPRGFTLVELLIATVLGMLIVLLITSLVVSSKSAQSTQHNAALLQETARYALDNISRSVKQAGYIELDHEDGMPLMDTNTLPASIIGLDGGSLKATSYGMDSPTKTKNASDILALRFFGSNVDNAILNCAGSGVLHDNKQPGWSLYYVNKNDVNDEPALYCKYNSKSSDKDGKTPFTAQAIARGVESFQVLYGLNIGSTIQFLNATQISALDSNISEAELTQKTHWKKITAIKVAMLIRSTENARIDPTMATYYLFGDDYAAFGTSDKGTRISESDLPVNERNRLRKVVSTTIQLRNK